MPSARACSHFLLCADASDERHLGSVTHPLKRPRLRPGFSRFRQAGHAEAPFGGVDGAGTDRIANHLGVGRHLDGSGPNADDAMPRGKVRVYLSVTYRAQCAAVSDATRS